MQIVIEIPDVPIEDYQDLFHKIYGMAASEGLFDDKVKSQRALALKAVLDILSGITNGILLPKGHGDLVDRDAINNKFNAICDELEALSNQPTCKELLNKLSICLDTADPIIKDNYEEAENELWR